MLYGVLVRMRRIRPMSPREVELLVADDPTVLSDLVQFSDEILVTLGPLIGLRSLMHVDK
jgi:hypothetical protein